MIRRRLFAAIVLYGFAVGSVFYWSDGDWNWITMGINLASATAAMIFLHTRWAAKERQALQPMTIEDIFS
ncbi:MAG: hypothetical protein AAFY42_04770 [Pseudomonadota bacterium]